MKAFVHTKFGAPENLELKEMPLPEPKPGEVRIKIEYCAVNSWDVDIVKGRPLAFRPLFGWFKPKHPIIGIDVAGIIDAVGAEANDFSIGDRVFGDLSSTGFGCFAEYVCTEQQYLARVPDSIDMASASSIPHAGLLAWQGLHWKGRVNSGDKVLINGAGGGVGTISLQLCKHWGAEVTCIDRHDKLPMLNELGADQSYDYERTDYTKLDHRFDLIIDPVANKKAHKYTRILKPGGRLVIIGGKISTMVSLLLQGKRLNKKFGIQMGLLGYEPNRSDLDHLMNCFLNGWYQPMIHGVYSFDKLPQALTELGEGNVNGKIVVKVAND